MKALDQLLDPCEVIIDLDNHGAKVPLTARKGVMWHFDDSSSDKGAENWFRDPDFKLSYNRAFTDNGRRIRLTPSIDHEAYHGGVGAVEWGLVRKLAVKYHPDFEYGALNYNYFGLAITAGLHDQVTDKQFTAIVYDTAIIFKAAGWPVDELDARLVGHNEKAIFNPKDNPTLKKRWRQLGRKIDPIGENPQRPVLSLVSGRLAVAALLEAPDHPIWERFK